MMIVHGGFEAWGVPDASPACLKLKTYLRMVGLPYEAKMGDPRKGPTKKIPFIDLGGGNFCGDSGLIIEHLKRHHGDTLDAKLSAEDKARGHALRRTMEESLYFVLLYSRWCEDEAWPEMAKEFSVIAPPVIGGLVLRLIRGSARKNAFAQGIGRHKREDVYAIGNADVDAFGALLGDKPFVFGDEPSSYDACVYGQIANLLAFPTFTPLHAHVARKENVVRYVERIRERYWATDNAGKMAAE